jgi:unsaturated rhamnogalacturonyl hydrolase
MRTLPLVFVLACSQPEPDRVVHETLAEATALAEQGTAKWEPEGLYFGWIQAVWAYGVHRLHAATGEPKWHTYYADWMADEVAPYEGADPKAFGASDDMSPAILASIAMIEDPGTDFEPITDAAHLYLDTIERTEDGAIPHWGADSSVGPPNQVWVDSQFMFGVFFLREAQRTGDSAHIDAFVEQYQLFSQLCRDGDDQLYRHAWDDVAGQNIPTDAVYWARGNSWVLISAAELLATVERDSAEWDAVLPLFTAHAEAVADVQASDGLWHTVLTTNTDDVMYYTETSASALIAYALAKGVRSGALDDARYMPVVTRAVEGIRARIRDDGDELVVTGTSYGTNPGDYDYYVSIGQADGLMLGVGAVVMLFAEVDGLVASE